MNIHQNLVILPEFCCLEVLFNYVTRYAIPTFDLNKSP